MPSKVEIDLPNQIAFSINAATCRDARYKTAAFKDWYAKTKTTIQHNKAYKALQVFAAEYKQTTNQSIEVVIEIKYPNWLFYTSKGTISSKTFDVSNTEKILIDLLLGDLLDINDKNVTKLTSTKSPSNAYSIKISLSTAHFGTL